MCLKIDKKKLLGRHNKDISLNTFVKWLFNYFLKNAVLLEATGGVKNLAIFTGKHLCWSLFNSEHCEIFNSTCFEDHLRTVASENMFMKPRKTK